MASSGTRLSEWRQSLACSGSGREEEEEEEEEQVVVMARQFSLDLDGIVTIKVSLGPVTHTIWPYLSVWPVFLVQ